jgi:hypothetical protein
MAPSSSRRDGREQSLRPAADALRLAERHGDVQDRHELTRGGGHGFPLSRARAAVPALQERDAVSVGGDRAGRPVGRPLVADDDLEPRDGLQQRRLDRGPDELGDLVGGDDDREPGPFPPRERALRRRSQEPAHQRAPAAELAARVSCPCARRSSTARCERRDERRHHRFARVAGPKAGPVTTQRAQRRASPLRESSAASASASSAPRWPSSRSERTRASSRSWRAATLSSMATRARSAAGWSAVRLVVAQAGLDAVGRVVGRNDDLERRRGLHERRLDGLGDRLGRLVGGEDDGEARPLPAVDDRSRRSEEPPHGRRASTSQPRAAPAASPRRSSAAQARRIG